MKKMLLPATCLLLALSLAACQPKTDAPATSTPPASSEQASEKPANPAENQGERIASALEKVTDGAELPQADVIELDASNFSDYSFVEWRDGLEAVASEGAIATSAHSLVLVRSAEGKAEEVAREMAEKVDSKKWICVQPEVAKVLYSKNYAIMAMTFEKAYDKIKENFQNLVGQDSVQELDIKSNAQ